MREDRNTFCVRLTAPRWRQLDALPVRFAAFVAATVRLSPVSIATGRLLHLPTCLSGGVWLGRLPFSTGLFWAVCLRTFGRSSRCGLRALCTCTPPSTSYYLLPAHLPAAACAFLHPPPPHCMPRASIMQWRWARISLQRASGITVHAYYRSGHGGATGGLFPQRRRGSGAGSDILLFLLQE